MKFCFDNFIIFNCERFSSSRVRYVDSPQSPILVRKKPTLGHLHFHGNSYHLLLTKSIWSKTRGGGYLDLSSDGDVPFAPKISTHNSVDSGGF